MLMSQRTDEVVDLLESHTEHGTPAGRVKPDAHAYAVVRFAHIENLDRCSSIKVNGKYCRCLCLSVSQIDALNIILSSE